MVTEELIINKYKKALPKGFELVSIINTELKGLKRLNYSLKNDNAIYNINCCSLNSHPLGNILPLIRMTVSFKLVEKLIHLKIDESDYTTSFTLLDSLFPLVYDKKFILDKPIIFKTEADIDKGIAYVKSYIKKFAEDYFAYWNDIRAFLPFLESENVRFLNDLLVGKGENRKLIIWKLCNHPKYDLFLQETIKSYEDYLKENPKDKSEVKAYKEFKSLAKRLEKTKPLYDWDASYLTPKPFKGVMPIIP
ncbi:hypothetical protein KO500_06360 [Cellulophaga baltica]|uniref:hypothetical protein n=1 Tax=Cellulophaga TaxID=104264 RepID=UPI001C07A91C|nr:MULTISPECIES: hypothetical protein [Cellulophaga]MBU2996047.1 hypothetical protein [Cellulophaga baltica]MDO6767442.1 hypothetical protein [Cellulophaga sp. 1_MG-2023]